MSFSLFLSRALPQQEEEQQQDE